MADEKQEQEQVLCHVYIDGMQMYVTNVDVSSGEEGYLVRNMKNAATGQPSVMRMEFTPLGLLLGTVSRVGDFLQSAASDAVTEACSDLKDLLHRFSSARDAFFNYEPKQPKDVHTTEREDPPVM